MELERHKKSKSNTTRRRKVQNAQKQEVAHHSVFRSRLLLRLLIFHLKGNGNAESLKTVKSNGEHSGFKSPPQALLLDLHLKKKDYSAFKKFNLLQII